MTTQARAQVVPLRPESMPAVASVMPTESKTFNADFMARLRALNDTSRWLRSKGHPPVAVHLQGRLPAIHVDGAAARLLITQAQGFQGRQVGEAQRMCSVELRNCLITWFEPV